MITAAAPVETTTTTPAGAVDDTAADFGTNRATYCPEDNKLRLYVGRVPREEFLKLRAEGWTTLHKQRDAGGGDFVAIWTPERRDTALDYAGIIEDEDMGPAERAADRAERFAGYREKRTAEAFGGADRFDAGPMAHGYQSTARAERSARRHDRIAGRAVDAWSKAEYWQRRTAGVISHALHVAGPGVRMGRIKEIESDLRRLRARWETSGETMKGWAVDWVAHLELRLAYETQMITAQGGRAAFVEMEVGGWIGGHQIRKVNRSNATGRVVSVTLKCPGDRWGRTTEGFHMMVYNIERLPSGAYRAPRDEDKAALAAVKKTEKAAAPKPAPCPIVNPTDEDAERLQAIWNDRARADYTARNPYGREFVPVKVTRIKQATYSAASSGAYARAETRGVKADGFRARRASGMWSKSGSEYDKRTGPVVCKLRIGPAGHDGPATPPSVIVITDKPQKPLPAAVWQAMPATVPAETV
jgi:hypothetical protein